MLCVVKVTYLDLGFTLITVVVVYLRMCKNDQFCEGSWILVIALLRNHSDNSFMFQIISHSRNDIKLRKGNYL